MLYLLADTFQNPRFLPNSGLLRSLLISSACSIGISFPVWAEPMQSSANPTTPVFTPPQVPVSQPIVPLPDFSNSPASAANLTTSSFNPSQTRASQPIVPLPALPALPAPTEDKWIQQMAGDNAAAAPTKANALPMFRPPEAFSSGTVALPDRPVTSAVAQPSVPLATVATDAVNLPLLSPQSGDQRQPSSRQAEPVRSHLAQFNPAQSDRVQSDRAPGAPLPPLPTPATPAPTVRPVPPAGIPDTRPVTRSAALNPATLRFQGVNIYQGDENSARARVTGVYTLSPQAVVGVTIDFTDGTAFTDSPEEGISLNELYLAAAPIAGVPNLRLVIGQLDLTSYFDRNSFAKDAATHFFNPVFQTNPALAATGIGSRQAALVNWSITDNVEAKAAVFSSARSISDFNLNGFAGEVGVRFGNFIVRGTYASSLDAGGRSGFREIFQIDRGNGRFGPRRNDREDAYGVNAEIFIPEIKMGIFGRYGHYYNQDIDEGGDTYSAGISFLDLFAPADRLGVAYGRQLSNQKLRKRAGDRNPDVFEVFYDFALLPNLRVGLSYQAFEEFSESILGVRVRADFDLVSPRR